MGGARVNDTWVLSESPYFRNLVCLYLPHVARSAYHLVNPPYTTLQTHPGAAAVDVVLSVFPRQQHSVT